MSIAQAPALPSAVAGAAPPLPAAALEARFVLHGIPWQTYDVLTSSDLNNHLRMTYDEGDLEIMSPCGKHAKIGQVIACTIYEWMMLDNIDGQFGGDMTIKKRGLSKGIEADECYWITNAASVRGKDELDLAIDPPPDLALEVEVSQPLLPKLPIYQALGVPEVWHWRKNELMVLRLEAGSGYTGVKDSVELPGFPFELTKSFIERRLQETSISIAKHIRKSLAAQAGQ